MLNNYADSGGGFNTNHGQTARPTETQKQQNLGTSWSYNNQLEGIYYGSEHQPMYMGPYDGSAKHASYPQYPSGTLHQPVPTPVVQCHEACCQHYENRYPINPAPLRYQPNGPLQPRYSDIPNSDSRQYFPDRRPVQVNLPRKKVYPTENGYSGVSDRHYSQYMGRGQALPVDSRQQMQVMRPQYPVYPHYWGSSRGWAGARMNCPPPSYHQSVNQSGAQLQPGTKVPDSSQYLDPSLQKSLGTQHQRGVSSGSSKLDIIRPVPEPKRPTIDSSLQSCYEYGYPTGFLPFSEVNKIQGKSLNPQTMNTTCKIPPDKQYHPQQMQYSYQNNERNLISYGNSSNDPAYTMNFPLSANDLHSRPDLEEGQQSTGARKLPMHYDSSGKKRQDLDLRQYLSTWEDDEDESARLSEPPLPVGNTATPYIVVECSTLEGEAAAKLQDRFKPLPSSQDCSTKPRNSSPTSEHNRSNEPPRQDERTERTIVHSQPSYAPSMPTLLSDSDKNVNFWGGTNKDGESVIGKGGAFQPLDCSKRDNSIIPKVVPQRDSLPPRDIPAHKVLCSSDPNSSFDALVSFYGDNRRVSGGYDLVEMSERLINSSDKTRIDHQTSAELPRPCDPRLQQAQHNNNPSMYDKLSPRFSTNNYQHFKGVPSDPYYNYKHPMSSSEKYYGYENSSIINSNYDYNKFASEFDNTRLYGNKEAPKDPRRVLYADGQKNPDNALIEPLAKTAMPNCFQDKTSLEYTSLESGSFLSPRIEKSIDSRSEPFSQKSNSIEDGVNQQNASFSRVLNADIESQIQSEKTVLVTSQSGPAEVFRVFSPKKEMAHKDNVVTLHSGDQSKNNTITVEVPYVQQYSTLVKLSEEISRTDSVDGNEGRAPEDKTSAEEIKKPTCFKLKRLPNSKEWTVEGNESIESVVKEGGMCSPKSPEVIEDGDILKTSVSVSNLNMPSLDDIRDGEENCEVIIENHPKTKVSEGVLCSNKTSAQPPQLAIVQPMKLVPYEGKSPEPTLQKELNNEGNKTKQTLKTFRSFHSLNSNGASFGNEKAIAITDCDSEMVGRKTDISKHENFRTHKKIQRDFSNTFPNCLSSPNEGFPHPQEVNSDTTKQQYSPFHIYTDCEVNSQIPDFFKIDQRSSSNEKILDKQVPTSPGVEAMFEDINHSTNNQLCQNQIYQRKSCNYQDLTGPGMSSFDNHNSHFQSFSSIFSDDSNNKGRCDGSVLHMGDKKYLKHLLDDIERDEISNTLEERVSKLKSNFMNETPSVNKTCEAKKSPPIPPINLKLNESKKVWCITNKEQHLSLNDFSENSSNSLTSKSATIEKSNSLLEHESVEEKCAMEIFPEEINHQSCYRSDVTLHPPSNNFNDFGNCDKTEKGSILNQLASETTETVYSSDLSSVVKEIDTSTQIPLTSGIDLTNKTFSENTSNLTIDVNDVTRISPSNGESKKENFCLSIVKYYPRYEILKGNLLNNIDCSVSQNILIFDEKGTHFPQECNEKDSQYVESESIAKNIVELLITNVVFSREMIKSPQNEHVSDFQDKLIEPDKFDSTREENIETVIKFDQSSSSSKIVNEQKHISKTTEMFIEHEKEHNQKSSVIKTTQSEKYLRSLDEKKDLFRSIFSPMPDDGKENNPIQHCKPSVESKLSEEKDSLNFDFSDTKNNSDKMEVDVMESSDENQPLDYSLGDVTIQEDTSLNGSTSGNVTSSNSSEGDGSIDGKDLENTYGCSVGFSVSNQSLTTENNNFKSFSIKKTTNESCSKNLPLGIDSETDLKADVSKHVYQLTNSNCDYSTMEDSFSSDKSNFESDFDVSDSEPTNEKESNEAVNFMDVTFSSENVSSNSISKNEPQLLTTSFYKDEERMKIRTNKTPEAKCQSHILEVDSPEQPYVDLAIFAKDKPVGNLVEEDNKSVNHEGNLTTKESLLLNCFLKDANSLKNKVSEDCSLSKEESLGNESEKPRDDCTFKASEDKRKEPLAVTSSFNCVANQGSIPKFHLDERSETSVIVRNNTFTNSINSQGKESSSKYFDNIKSNAKNKCVSPASMSITVNKDIPDESPNNIENPLMPDFKEKLFEEATSNNSNDSYSEQCNLITEVSNNDETIVSDNANENESMEVESPRILPVDFTKEIIFVNTSVSNNSVEEKNNNLKLCYCVSESSFLNSDKESVLCSERSSASYLFDFKRRKILKFCKSLSKPQCLLNENSTNYSRDFSIINFGMNDSQQSCSPKSVVSDVTYPMNERSHFNNTQNEINLNIEETVDDVDTVPLSSYKKTPTALLKSSFNSSEAVDPPATDNKSEKTTVPELKNYHFEEEEDSTVLKPNKNVVVIKNKLCLPQEINTFCIRRDSLKLLEPDAVLKEIFSPDPDIEDSESKENHFSANHIKDKRKSGSNNSEKSNLTPITATSSASLDNDACLENKSNSINSFSTNYADVNFNLLNAEKDEPLGSTNLGVCILDVNSETDHKGQPVPTDEKDVTKLHVKMLKLRDGFKNNICKEQLSFIDADLLDDKKLIEDHQDSITSSLNDKKGLDISCKSVSKNISESDGYFTNRLSDSDQASYLYPSKSVESSDQTSASTKMHNECSYEKKCNQTKVTTIEEPFSHDEHRSRESESAPHDTQTLSCQISNLDNRVSRANDIEKSISSMGIVTGRDVLFSSRFLEDEEDKELNSELQTENRSRKSSVEEESILDCQNMKINSQDSLRGGNHLGSETFPLQCLVDAALALENVDTKQMLLNSSSFSGIYSQSSQSLIKSTIDDVHPNDIEDFPEKHSFSSSNSDPVVCKENKLSAADKEVFSKFEENNYNLRASTRIVTSSSSNIIPYSKRYYKLKSQKRPKPSLEKSNKSETLNKKIQAKKRKDVFTYPRSKRRKKGMKDKPKYQQLKKLDFNKINTGNNCTEISSKDGLTQNSENDVYEKSSSSSINQREDCFQSSSTNQTLENYSSESNLPLLEKSNFGGPLIIANENSHSESNIFCVHVNSDKMDEYVNDLNVEGLELLSEHNQSVFKENSIEEQCEAPDVTLENGTSLVIIIEQLGENGEKDSYYNTCKGDSDVILGGIEERSPLPQPNSILDYSSDNLTSEVSINESCICPSGFINDRTCEHSLFKDSKLLESDSSLSYKCCEMNHGKFESYEKYSAECNQELLTTNCYEEINETLVNDIGNWPFVEEEVAEFNTKSVSPDRIPEEGRKIELKCSLPWNKIFNMTKTKKKKSKTSHKVSGLELGPAKVEVRLRAPSTEWKVISDYAENTSPVVKVSRLILQRESETSSYSEKDSEEENDNRKLSPLSVTSEINDTSDSNDISKNLIENESWQPIVLLTRDKELDELTLSRTRRKELDEATQSETGDKELVEFALTLESPHLPNQSTLLSVSSQNNDDGNKDDSGSELSEESRANFNVSELSKSNKNPQTNLETDGSTDFPEERNINTRYQNTKSEKGCTYETYSPSRHDDSHVDETIYSPSDPHYSPEPGYLLSDNSSVEDKKNSDMSSESDSSHAENHYNSPDESNFGSFNAFNKESGIHRAACFERKGSLFRGTSENVNFHDSETSDTNYSSETPISSLFDRSRGYLAETKVSLGEDPQIKSHYVRPDLLDTPNIISNEARSKSDLRNSVAEENLRKFKRKMPKNFFVRRKSRKNADQQNGAAEKTLREEKQDEVKPGGSSFLPDEDLFPTSTEFVPIQRRSSNSSEAEIISNEWQTVHSSNLMDERLNSTSDNLSFASEDSRLPCLEDVKDSYPMRLNDSPMVERFEEKLRLRDGGRGLKRPCEGHSKEDTKRRRKNDTNHSNKCQECDVQFETKEELSQHVAQNHAATRELHHCLLCQRSFSSGARHRLHVQGRSHRHLELTQRHAIHTVHRLLGWQDCPHIPPLSDSEVRALQWRPAQPGYSHYYYQLTPLQRVLEEHNSEATTEAAVLETRTPND